MKSEILLLGILSYFSLTTGCIHINKKVNSILKIDSVNRSALVSVGFRDVMSSPDGKIIAYGWHPREHETYCSFVNEPQPVVLERWLLLKPNEESCLGSPRVELWLMNGLRHEFSEQYPPFVFEKFVGEVHNSNLTITSSRNSVQVSFNNVLTQISSSQKISVSGCLQASVVSNKVFNDKCEQLKRSVEAWTAP